MKLSAGDIVLARFPFTDLSTDKRRPVVFALTDGDEDVIVCAITSKPRNGPYDVAVTPNQANGLKASSWVQFDKIATLSRAVISGRLGALPDNLFQERTALLHKLFGLPSC